LIFLFFFGPKPWFSIGTMKAKMEGPHARGQGQSFAAFVRRAPAFAFNWHYHPELELTYILRSRGVRMVGDHVEDYRAGDLVFLGSNLPHTWASDETPYAVHEAIVIQFREGILPPMDLPEMAAVKRLIEDAARGIHFQGRTIPSVAARMGRILRQKNMAALTDLLAILHALGKTKRRRLLASRHYVPRLGEKQRNRFERVVRFLEQNAGNGEASLTQVARLAHMAPAAFSRFFRKMAGKSYVRFRNETRIAHACRMLIDTDHPITQVAFESGFGNLSNFNRHFRALKKMPPSSYRRLHEPAAR
jgi:AraC-like DNA-binding protein/quercetin dioxygenase-like cupin family protein